MQGLHKLLLQEFLKGHHSGHCRTQNIKALRQLADTLTRDMQGSMLNGSQFTATHFNKSM